MRADNNTAPEEITVEHSEKVGLQGKESWVHRALENYLGLQANCCEGATRFPGEVPWASVGRGDESASSAQQYDDANTAFGSSSFLFLTRTAAHDVD
ncbi:hypothetical protein WJX77_005274 [Trebouxia sp. C0004]